MSNSLTKEVYSQAAATEFFSYGLLTVDYLLGTLYALTQLVSTWPGKHALLSPCCRHE